MNIDTHIEPATAAAPAADFEELAKKHCEEAGRGAILIGFLLMAISGAAIGFLLAAMIYAR